MNSDFPELRDRLKALHGVNQETLIGFLATDTAVGFELLETAKATGDPLRKPLLIDAVQKAVLTIRHFADRIENPGERARIEEGASRLEESLAQLSK